MGTVNHLLYRLEGVQGKGPRWRARCPSHGSAKNRSLSILETDDGRVLLHCHGGCDVGMVLGAVGLEFEDLYPKPVDDDQRGPRVKKPWSSRQVAKALEQEATVAWVLLSDIGGGKVVTKSDRERARLAGQRCAALLGELANAH